MPVQCPVCGHERSAPFLRCSACGTTFRREVFERYDHLTFLLAELDDWVYRGLISESLRQVLAKSYQQELEALEADLGVAAPTPPTPPAEIGVERAGEAWPQIMGPAIPPREPTGAPAAAQEETTFVVEEPEAAVPPPLPRPKINWENIWQALLSPRALEALLYVGAFLIIVAAAPLCTSTGAGSRPRSNFCSSPSARHRSSRPAG